MTCRSCYAATLSSDELDRFNAEPVTSCVYLCDEHRRRMDALRAPLEGLLIRAARKGPTFSPG